MNRLTTLLSAAAAAMLIGCGQPSEPPAPAPQAAPAAPEEAASPAPEQPSELARILDAQPDEMKARYAWRHPQETLTLFDIQPGQTVMEVLPGGGWYSKVLLPYLGSEGRLIGATYEDDMWARFGFFPEETIEERKQWAAQWPDEVAGWGIEGAAPVSGYTLGTLPEELSDSVDRVLFVRALHNLARFESDRQYLSRAVAETARVLKPGGLVGVVQHRAPNDAADEWANGEAGYLKQGFVTRTFLEAGFELAMTSEINRNPADQPTAQDIVWRLPPSLGTSGENPELRAQLEAIGESDRMTLVFRKPEA